MGPLRVGLLFGGRSVEHEVSVISARGVDAAMSKTSLKPVPIAVTPAGRWAGPAASREILDGDAARVPEAAADATRLVADPGEGLLEIEASGSARRFPVDVVFPLVHGWGGEDGRVQGMLDWCGIACVGAGVLGSANAMDKVVAKRLLQVGGVPVVPWVDVTLAEYDRDRGALVDQVADRFGYPVFVKPANGGSSVGVTRVAAAAGLAGAIEEACRHDRRALIEPGIDAREIECAVIGNDDPQASCLGEIHPSREFYDYASKYLDGTSGLDVPARLDGEVTDRIRRTALAGYRALDLAGFARVDFLLDRKDGTFYLNEANTLPGFTPISMFAKLWEASGIAYPDLVTRLVELALERRRRDSEYETRWRPS